MSSDTEHPTQAAFLAALAPSYRDGALELMKEPFTDAQALRTEVNKHLEHIRAATRENEFLDIDLAERLAADVQRMLALELDREQHAVVQAAARYFIREEDEAHDTRNILGLDDDADVVDAALAALGMEPSA